MSEPASPTIIGAYVPAIGSSYADVAVAGDYAYIADTYLGLQIINVFDPHSPHWVGGSPALDYAEGIEVVGNCAYLCSWPALEVFNVSNPAAPYRMGAAGHGCPIDVKISGNYAFVADECEGLSVFDVSHPNAPVFVAVCPTVAGCAIDVVVRDGRAYVADYSVASGLEVIDISDPVHPVHVGLCGTRNGGWAVAVTGDRACVADYLTGLYIMDISKPSAPTQMGLYDAAGVAHHVGVGNGLACVTGYYPGAQFIDVHDPANAYRTAPYTTEWGCGNEIGRSVVRGGYVYVAEGGGLEIVNVSEPTVPVQVAIQPLARGAWDIVLAGNGSHLSTYAYIADDTAGLTIVDVTDPGAPLLLGSCVTSDQAQCLAVAGQYVYVGVFGLPGHLDVMDVSDLLHPVRVGQYTLDFAWPTRVSTDGRYAYMVGGNGLDVLDLADPIHPQPVSHYELANVGGMAAAGDYVFLSDSYAVYVVNVSDPLAPTLEAFHLTPGMRDDLTLSAGYLYDAGDPAGLTILAVYIPGDLNCDGRVDFDDINPFVLALGDANGYTATYPECHLRNADINADGAVDFDDINPFVELLASRGK